MSRPPPEQLAERLADALVPAREHTRIDAVLFDRLPKRRILSQPGSTQTAADCNASSLGEHSLGQIGYPHTSMISTPMPFNDQVSRVTP